MVESLRDKTCMNTSAKKEGLEMLTVICDTQLPDGLVDLALKCARGDYTHIKVVPGDIALAGSDYRFEKPHHVVYGIDTKKKKGELRIICPNLVYASDGYLAPATVFVNQID